MQHIFAWAFRSCANSIFHSVSPIYCSFHTGSHSCGSDEGSLQPSLWLPRLSSILQKLAKCSTALHGTSGVAAIEFFAQISTICWSFHSESHSCGSDKGSLQTAIIMDAKIEQYIAETCKMQHSFAWVFRSCAHRFFHSVSAWYCSFHSASHSCGTDVISLQPSSWLPKLSSILQKLAKCSTAFHGPF